MFCPNCGTENREDAIYCNLCQEPLQRYSQETPDPSAAGAAPPASPPGGPPAGAEPARSEVPPVAPNVWAAGASTPYQQGTNAGVPPQPPYRQAAGPYSAGYPPYQQAAGSYSSSYPGYPGYPVIVAQAPRTPGEATASLVLGILGLLFCPLICSLLAIIFGVKARNMIDASGGYLGGRGVAQAGLIMGVVGMALYTVGTIVYMILLAAGGSSSGFIPFL